MAYTVDTVFVWVNALEESVSWYQLFGIEAGPAYGDWQPMKIDGDTVFALHAGERVPGPSTAVVAFGADDLDGEIERLSQLGIPPIGEITDTGVSRFATFVDPDGNEVQLLERYQ